MFTSLLLTLSGATLIIQLAGFGSAVMLFLLAVPLLVALAVDTVVKKSAISVSLVTYAVAQFVPLLVGTQMICVVFDVFIPLVSGPL